MNPTEKLSSIEYLHELMPNRIRSILLVSTLYDAFIIEKDGQIIEQICDKFLEQNLIYIPRITRVSTRSEALSEIDSKKFDLVITMLNLPDTDAFALAEAIKNKNPRLPVVLLLSDPSYLGSITAPKKDSVLDGVFFWRGDPALFLPIIKCLEDKMNAEHDVATGLVKIVLVVDDSIKYYSMFLPVIYKEVMDQTHRLIMEGLNEVQKLTRMRTRPKILLVSNFEDAIEIFNRHKLDIIGIISDISFPKENQLHDTAGFDFARYVRSIFFDLPIILMSSDNHNQELAEEFGISYVNKNSQTFHSDLRTFIVQNLGFGDFIFRHANGKEVTILDNHGQMVPLKASNLKELQECLSLVPSESLLYHTSRNHISIWLTARGKYEIALKIRPKQVSDFGGNIENIRSFLYDTILSYRLKEQSGIVVQYQAGNWDCRFIQLGKGSLGGKARGIAFVNYLLTATTLREKFKGIRIRIPKTVAITVEEFDQFIAENRLQEALEIKDDNAIAQKFIEAELSLSLQHELMDFIENCDYPLAVRSSSLLEDSQFLPFAGIYSTYMLPNNHPDLRIRLENLMRAIKLVYASVYFKQSRSYIESTPYQIDEEKMGIVIQQIVGRPHRQYYYPTFSGVAKSYNYYPFSYMKPEEGVAQVCMGLGRLVIEGGNALRFSPRYPEIIPQFSSVSDTFKNSQNYFYALDLKAESDNLFIDDSANLVALDINKADLKSISTMASVYDIEEHAIKEDLYCRGPKIITFANILKYNQFPLAKLLLELLGMLRHSIAREIEIEFAANLFERPDEPPIFNILQVRPLVINKEEIKIDDEDRKKENSFCRCLKALGNGVVDTHDVVYVDPDRFDTARTREMAVEIGKINAILKAENRFYLLIGMGRWGTADPWLGIPVNWDQISNVKALVEASVGNFFFEPSQGSHFFQNITARAVGYFSLAHNGEDFVDWEYLKMQPSMIAMEYVRHIRFSTPVCIKINGKTGEGIITKPIRPLCGDCGRSGFCRFRNKKEMTSCEE